MSFADRRAASAVRVDSTGDLGIPTVSVETAQQHGPCFAVKCFAGFGARCGMPLNYSKFDHLVDSDDEKLDPKAAAAEARRKMLQEMQKKDPEPPAAAPADRFSYAEAAMGDFNEVAQELLKLCVSKAPSVKVPDVLPFVQSCQVSNGVLSVALVEKVEGEASMFQAADG
eukprot:Skav213452  [mRNA]  locus=scaffold837:553368:559213:- [translate_table: standard]